VIFKNYLSCNCCTAWTVLCCTSWQCITLIRNIFVWAYDVNLRQLKLVKFAAIGRMSWARPEGKKFLSITCYNIWFCRGYKGRNKILEYIFRPLRIVAKSDCLLCRVRPSVCPHVSARLPLDEFLFHSTSGTFMKVYRQNPNLVTIGQKYRTSTWTKYLLLLQVRKFRYKSSVLQQSICLLVYRCQWYVAQKYT
jgi:hypothetical protein